MNVWCFLFRYEKAEAGFDRERWKPSPGIFPADLAHDIIDP